MRYNKQTGAWILLFFLVNFCFFLPGYLLYSQGCSFLPSTRLPDGESLGKLSHLFVRNNQDLFRISIDWFIMGSLLFLIKKKGLSKILFVFTWLWFSFLFFYQIYLQISLKVYGEIPNFENDWVLVQDVLPLFLDQFSSGNKGLIYVGFFAGVGLVLGLLYLLIRWYYRKAQAVPISRKKLIWLAGIALLLAVFVYKNTRSTYPPNFNSVQLTYASFSKSLQAKGSTPEQLQRRGIAFESYADLALAYKPDVYLLFVESYGELLYQQDQLREPYFEVLAEVENTLTQDGFHSQSYLSEAPIIGGRSWLAFTSAFCGQRIPDQLTFNEMLKLDQYPHLIRLLNQQGYETFRIKSMSDNQANVKADYSATTRFYEFDQWLKFKDFPYKGFKYDWFGGLPDQYVLNYFEEEVPKDSTKPTFTFFINMNSHGPWFPAPPLVEDWRSLDTVNQDMTLDFDSLIDTAPIHERYGASIAYQLRYLTQFMLTHADEEDLFILIGDHQPALIHRPGLDGFLTPIHVISKDKRFAEHFKQYDFQSGLRLDVDRVQPMKHADLYPMFIKALQALQE